MRKEIKALLLIFLAIAIIKIIASSFIPAPTAFADEYYYIKMAQSFLSDGNFLVHGERTIYPCLYPAVISLAYLGGGMDVVYFLLKAMSALLSSLIIIPAWLLAREFMGWKKALWAAAVVGVLPSSFAFSGYVLAENLFYPLVLFTVYMLYKALTTDSIKYSLLVGAFIGASILTKYSAAVLLVLPLAGVIIRHLVFKEGIDKAGIMRDVKLLLLIYLPAIALVLIWAIPEIVNYGLSASGPWNTIHSDVTAVARHSDYFGPFFNWILLYCGYLLLSSGVIFGATSLLAFKNAKLKLFAIMSFVAVALFVILGANHAAGGPQLYLAPFKWFTERPIGRYVEAVVPLIVILGAVGFQEYERKKLHKQLNRLLIGCSVLLAWSAQLTIATLFPVNNLSLTLFGLIRYAFELIINKAQAGVPAGFMFSWPIFIAMLIIFSSIPLILIFLNWKKKLSFNKVVAALMIYFLLVGGLVYYVNYANAKDYWYNSEQMTLSRWMGDTLQEDLLVILDGRDCGMIAKTEQLPLCHRSAAFSLMGVFIKNPILKGGITEQEGPAYFITMHETPGLELLKKTEHYYVYEKD